MIFCFLRYRDEYLMFNDDIQVISIHDDNGDTEYDDDGDDDNENDNDDGNDDDNDDNDDEYGTGHCSHCAVRPLRGNEGPRSWS